MQRLQLACLIIFILSLGFQACDGPEAAPSLVNKSSEGNKPPVKKQTQDTEAATGESSETAEAGDNPEPPASESGPPQDSSEIPIELKVQAVLERACLRCHNPSSPQGNFGTLGNLDELISNQRYIVAGSPEQSLLFTKLAPTGNMPPDGSLPNEDIELIRNFINNLQIKKNAYLSEKAVLELLKADLEANVPSAQRRDVRYFSMHIPNNLDANAGTMEVLRTSFFKIVNSLSRSSNIVTPLAIDDGQILWRINLNDLRMSTSRFNEAMQDFYPFAKRLSSRDSSFRDHEFLRREIGTDFYMLRLDWFVATAPLPELYSRLLNLARSQQELERDLGINLLRNVRENKAIRAGFKNSNVSSQNRIIERHAQANGRPYWISYDFASNEGRANIFEVPLGPVGTGNDSRSFIHDGGEIIFQLPNGLLGFYLSNAAGVQIDKGPTSIVKQQEAPAEFISAIVNGISCMNCHHQGLLYKKDDIREFIDSGFSRLSRSERQKALSLFVNEETFKREMDKDNESYRKKLNELGMNPFGPDPVNQAYRYYNRALTKRDIREELGFDEESYERLLSDSSIRRQWSSLFTSGGFISRNELNEFFEEALRAGRSDFELLDPDRGDIVLFPACMFEDPLQTDNCLVRRRRN